MADGKKSRLADLAGLLRTWSPRTNREAGDAVVKTLLFHWFPAKVNRRSVSTTYSYWLGTISAALFGILTLSGVVLMFLYVPSVERAYGSIKDLESAVTFGPWLRASHRIGAHLMVGIVFLHMVRVYLTGAFKNGVLAHQNRPLNWWIGLGLLFSTLLLSFTGYLLPWDQLAYWAITVGTNIASAVPVVGDDLRAFLLGGHEIGQNTLIRFYVLHCFFLPALLTLLVAWHMWRIRKDGGLACVDRVALDEKAASAPPVRSKTYSLLGITSGRTVHVETTLVNEEAHQATALPTLVWSILTVSLLTFAATSALAVWLGSPLEEAANPQLTPNPAKAPWYFLWLQELVTITTLHIGSFTLNGALVGGVLLPGLLLLLGAGAPWLDRSGSRAVGVWFHRDRLLSNTAFLVVCTAIVVLTLIGTFMRGPFWNFYWPWEQWPVHPPRL